MVLSTYEILAVLVAETATVAVVLIVMIRVFVDVMSVISA
jgi:hypothetical protein